MNISDQQFNQVTRGNFEELISLFRDSEIDLISVNRLCSYICDAPISLVNFLDDFNQYTISRSGAWPYQKIAVDHSICHYTLSDDELLIIDDAKIDFRTKDFPYVTDNTLQFYAGVPIPNQRGRSFGTLCIIDDKPRTLTNEQKSSLKVIADQLQYRIESIQQEKDYEKVLKILEQKDTLFYEIHHRIKNNLADICGMLQIEWFESEDHAVREVLSKAESRILAVIKLHEVLYESDELIQTNLHRYIEQLIRTILTTSAKAHSSISYELNIGDIMLSMNQSLSVGLILNELISNASRHAFRDMDRGFLSIEASEDERGRVQLIFRDNGVGFDLEGKNLSDFGNLGLKLVELLAQQLNGEIHLRKDNGAIFHLSFLNENSIARDSAMSL